MEPVIEITASLIALIISIALGIFSMIYMVRNSPRRLTLIIHGLVFLGSLIGVISIITNIFSGFIKYGFVIDGDIYQFGWPFPLLLLFSGYLTIHLLRKDNFAEKWKYALGLSSGMIIASVLFFIFLVMLSFVFQWDGLGVGIMFLLIFMGSSVLSILLGIIGFFIDKS